MKHPDTIQELDRLLEIIRRLRAPDGCPWDREQDEQSMAPHLLEECYEALEAIEAGDAALSCEELGDVLMNVLMIAQIAGESERFDTAAVARGIADKLVRRHPHVFGETEAKDSAAVLENWEQIKKQEKGGAARGALEGVPRNLPALLRGYRIGEKAARVGFDWPDRSGPRAKLDEELGELDEAIAKGDRDAQEQELGDLLFSVVNLARHLEINPEMALRQTASRFGERFAWVEAELGEELKTADLARLEAAWSRAKARESERR